MDFSGFSPRHGVLNSGVQVIPSLLENRRRSADLQQRAYTCQVLCVGTLIPA
jgi:hypothetical protein